MDLCFSSNSDWKGSSFNVQFIYSEKATKFCEISTKYLTYIGQIIGGDFAKLFTILGQKFIKFLRWVFGKLKTPKSHSEIN